MSGKAPFALRILKDNQLLKTKPIEVDSTYIGRMPENHIVLDDKKVSRSHARITRSGDGYVIEDQDSENGLYLKGKRVKQITLKVGEKIGIGDHVLEVIEAPEDLAETSRVQRLTQASEESGQWRNDQTLSISPEKVAQIIANIKAQPTKSPVPKVSIRLTLGKEEFFKEFEINQGREKRDEDPPGNFIEMRIGFGKWVLYKKETL